MIQLKLDTSTNVGFNGNGSIAKSEGVELAVESHPLTGLTLSGWVAYDDAAITDPPGHGALYA